MIRRNLISIIRRYPVAVILNFTGLVAAFVAFTLIFLQADYELSFDKCYPTAERVFRADKAGDESLFRNVLPRGFADDIINSSAHIEAGCTIVPFFGDTYFTVEEDDKVPVGYKRKLFCASERFIDVFGLTMVEGDSHSLEIPGSVIIPKSLAEILFPGESAIGKLLKTDAKFLLKETSGESIVTGVYEDFPANCQLDNDLYVATGDFQKSSYGGANFVCYLLLDDKDNAQAVADEFNARFDFSRFTDWLTPIELVPLTSIYFRNEGNIYKSGSRSQLLLLIAIAILILAIGLINFTNFYISLTPLRIRSIHLQRILGASTAALRTSIIAEAVVWCICAFGIASLLSSPISEAMSTSGILMQSFSLDKHMDVMVLVGFVALATGIIAGVMPSIYATSGQPALILRGNYGLSESGKKFRAVLVGMQFIVSIILLVFVLFVQRQSRFMQEYPCGYDKDNLAVVDIGGNNSELKAEWLRTQLRQLPEVVDVAYSMELIGGSDTYSTSGADFGDGMVQLSMMYCSYNLPQVLGIQVTDGRDFRENDYGQILLTQDLKARGAEKKVYADEFGDGANIIGFVNNVNITSMRKTDSSVGFQVFGSGSGYVMPYAYIRIAKGTDRIAALEKITRTLTEMDPVTPFEVRFYDSIGKNLYSGEERLRLEIWLFSLLAILISLVGIWGQVLMDIQYKKTEIAIKRVFGAGIKSIANEGLWTYMRSLVLCFVIAAPIGWLIVQHYLQQFSHRVGFSIWVFVLTFAIVAILCAAVVLSHYFKAANANPAAVLKKE